MRRAEVEELRRDGDRRDKMMMFEQDKENKNLSIQQQQLDFQKSTLAFQREQIELDRRIEVCSFSLLLIYPY